MEVQVCLAKLLPEWGKLRHAAARLGQMALFSAVIG
jgi:hypothetical protein